MVVGPDNRALVIANFPAGEGSKPPHAALAEDRRSERCGKGASKASGGDQFPHQHVQPLQKTLEDANIKVASVVSDVTGTSGRAILRALIAGETDPEKLLAVTTGRLRADRASLLDALHGRVRPSHRFLLKLHIDQVEAIEQAIAAVDAEVETLLAPFRKDLQRLTTILGVGEVAARVILSEVGVDMTHFPSVGHLISWAGLCPRNDESAGKRRSTRLRPEAPWLKTLLVQCAWAAVRVKATDCRLSLQRIGSRS